MSLIISNAIKVSNLIYLYEKYAVALGVDNHLDVVLKAALVLAPIELILTIIITYFIFKRNILFRKLFVILCCD